MLVRKLKRDRYRIAMGPTGAHRLVGARPMEHGCGFYFGRVKEKSNRSIGVKGACPLMLPPPTGGERGSPSQFPRQLKKLGLDFYRVPFFINV